jgi:outer membrane protein assembly factor BamA
LLLTFASSLLGQKYVAKNIVFKGQTEYSDAELLAATGLKKGQALTSAEMNDISKQLLDLGVFDNVAFTFNGQDLAFDLIPSVKLYPVQLENLPLAPGKELVARIHAKVPLYHGKVPIDGGLLAQVNKALEDELAAKGIQASLISTPANDTRLGTTIGVSFTETTPPVVVGEIKLQGLTAAMANAAQAAATKLTGTPFSQTGSPSVLETSLGNTYHEHGFLQAEAKVELQYTPVVDAASVHVPFSATIDEGPLYHLAAVQLDPAVAVTQSAYDKQATVHPGDIAYLDKLRKDWEYIARQYHNQGMMKAKVEAAPTYDRPKALVTFNVTTVGGPIYKMGVLRVGGAGPDLLTAIQNAWKMPRGSVFNEGAILGFFASSSSNPQLQKFFASVTLRYALHLNDDERTVDVDLRFEKKP